MYLILLLAACPVPAERAGVEIPKGGADALSQEDLQRDLWLLMAPEVGPRRPGQPGHAEGLRRLEARLAAMKTLPGYGDAVTRTVNGSLSLCTHKAGRGDRAVVIAALDEGDGADRSGASLAALISLAKAWDLPEVPRHGLYFCALPEPGGLAAWASAPAHPLARTVALVTLGPIAGPGALSVEEGQLAGVRRVHVTTGPQPWHGTPEDKMERVSYEDLLARVQQIHEAVQALQGL